MKFRAVIQKTVDEIASEWDLLAPVRQLQIENGIDRNYIDVIKPTAIELVRRSNAISLLDVGCGIGDLTSDLGKICNLVVGIDPSRVSIAIAETKNTSSNVSFAVSSVEDFVGDSKFDAVIANMVLMDVIDLKPFLAAIKNLLASNGTFIFSITHPCFWPSYYGYDQLDWFSYLKDTIIESPFRIANDQDLMLISTHVHRPINRYVDLLSERGFYLDKFIEPLPSPRVQSNRFSNTPHILFASCKTA